MNEVIEQGSKPVFATRLAPLVRFLVVGTVNSLLSIAVYQAVLFVTGHVAAYVVAYVAGIVFAYVAYSRHVFHAILSARRFGLFALFYIFSGCVGTLVNASLIDYLGLHARIAIFITIVVMLPFNYAGSRWCMHKPAGTSQ